MSKMNGGSIGTPVGDFELFPFLDATDRKRLRRTCSSIDRETNSARQDRYGFPPQAVAIGTGGGGDILILLPMPDKADTLQHSVYWWDHESGQIEVVATDFLDLRRS